MGRFALSQSDDWQLENQDQDIRGWTVRDADGNDLGTVTELIASTESEQVETLVLDTGEEYPASDVALHDGVVYVEGIAEDLGTEVEPVIRTYDNARVARR